MSRPVNNVPTIKEVARRAGVSIATVSRVLNGGNSSEQTGGRVRAAAQELGFRPNLLGRSLKTARTKSIGVLIPSLSNPVFGASAEGIEDAAQAVGHSVIVSSSHYDPSRERGAVDQLLAKRVDGLIVTVADADASPILDTLDAEGVPYTLLYNQPVNRHRSYVAVDNVGAARGITEFLIKAGHRSIGMIMGKTRASDRSRLRHLGYCTALKSADLAVLDPLEIGFEETDFAERLAQFLRRSSQITALFCSNDMLAITTIASLRRIGIRVPEDISIVGFDGIQIGSLIAPSVTTVVQPIREMAAAAFHYLMARIDGQAESETLRLCMPHTIWQGDSVAPPSSCRKGGM